MQVPLKKDEDKRLRTSSRFPQYLMIAIFIGAITVTSFVAMKFEGESEIAMLRSITERKRNVYASFRNLRSLKKNIAT